jgi:hypothetical protein
MGGDMKLRKRLRKIECINHRTFEYYKSLDKLMMGFAPPGYAAERWNKLKKVRGR